LYIHFITPLQIVILTDFISAKKEIKVPSKRQLTYNRLFLIKKANHYIV